MSRLPVTGAGRGAQRRRHRMWGRSGGDPLLGVPSLRCGLQGARGDADGADRVFFDGALERVEEDRLAVLEEERVQALSLADPRTRSAVDELRHEVERGLPDLEELLA